MDYFIPHKKKLAEMLEKVNEELSSIDSQVEKLKTSINNDIDKVTLNYSKRIKNAGIDVENTLSNLRDEMYNSRRRVLMQSKAQLEEVRDKIKEMQG